MAMAASRPTPRRPGPGTAGTASPLSGKHFLGISDWQTHHLLAILDEAAVWRQCLENGSFPQVLTGKTIVTLFFEPSTRTAMSFRQAVELLGGRCLDLPLDRSSVAKGESLEETLKTVQALGADGVIFRHPSTGAARFAADRLRIPVVNAGDGMGEHPTQALLDALTIRERKGRISGLRVAILGDILHSRVARSNLWLLPRLGAEVRLAGPPGMVPLQGVFPGVRVMRSREEALASADVVMTLRVQQERWEDTRREEALRLGGAWCLRKEHLAPCKPDVILMHPGPVNREIELEAALLEDPRCVVHEQTAHGVAVRMAVLSQIFSSATQAADGPQSSRETVQDSGGEAAKHGRVVPHP